MAQQGLYADPPSRRMAYDGDGSTGMRVQDGVSSLWSTATMEGFNGEKYQLMYDNGGFAPYGYFCVLFPELRDVTHCFRNMGSGTYAPSSHYSDWTVSTNTTNGVDGNWVTSNGYTAYVESTSPAYRSRLGVVGANGVKGIRFLDSTSHAFNRPKFYQWHIHGYKTAGETPHRIDFCDNTGNVLTKDNDFGDQPRNSERIWNTTTTWNQGSGLYIKNLSPSKQAQTITVSFQVVNASSDMSNHIALSLDGVTYSPSVTFTSLNPLSLAGPIYISNSPSVTANLGLKAGRLLVSVGTWV